MISRSKIAIIIVSLLLISWTSWSVYNYFLDTSSPTLSVEGIVDNGYYGGDVTCVVTGSDGYKVYDISVLLDGKPLVSHYKINRKSFEYSFVINTKTIPNGKHNLKITIQDASYNRNVTAQELNFIVDNTPLQAAFVKPDADYKVFQGKTLHLQFQANKELKEAWAHGLSQKYPFMQEAANSLIYECFMPVKTDEIPNEYLLTIEVVDKLGNTMALETKFHVVAFPFKKQQLKLNTEKVKSENELGLPEKQLEIDLEEALKNSPQKKLWQGVFYIPCEMRGISTEFGTIRTTQERGKYPHNAIDILGTPRSVVWAMQDGIVAIKNRYAHSGNTIVIDHGYGIFTLYYHLDSFANVSVGDKIKKGQPIGTIGMSGYASGFHLHLEMRNNNIAVDPVQWTRHDF